MPIMPSEFSGVPFEFGIRTRIVFGTGASTHLADVCKRFGFSSAFVVMDPGVQRTGIAEAALRSLTAAGIPSMVFTRIEPNPIDADIEAGYQVFAADRYEVIIGIGGGSALDTAKGIAMLATNGGRIRDYDGNDRVPHDAWPVIAIPTTAGTGSEVTANISVTNSDTHDKMAVRSIRNYARVAVLDPSLLSSLPASVAAASGMDALVHAIEGYVSTRACPPTDLLALEAIRILSRSLSAFVQERSNQSIASAMLYASCLAGMVITHTGTGLDHALARAIGGFFNVVHGVACGALLGPVMTFNLEVAEARYADIAQAMGVARPDTTPHTQAEAAVSRIEEIRVAIDLPKTLPVHIAPPQDTELVALALRNHGPNPRQATRDDVEHILAQVTAA